MLRRNRRDDGLGDADKFFFSTNNVVVGLNTGSELEQGSGCTDTPTPTLLTKAKADFAPARNLQQDTLAMGFDPRKRAGKLQNVDTPR